MKKSVVISIALVLFILVIAAGITGVLAYRYFRSQGSDVSNFDECVAKGYPVMESFPERCAVPGGATFVKQLPEQTVTITGEIECLPHKNTDGPQTLECAFGIKDDNDIHYGLHDPELKYLASLPTGKRVTITGIFRSSTDPNNKYDSVGTIEIRSIDNQ